MIKFTKILMVSILGVFLLSGSAFAVPFGNGGAALQGVLDGITTAPVAGDSSVDVTTDALSDAADSYWAITGSGASASDAGEVRTILNRRRKIQELQSKRKREQRAGERIAVNTVIQGSAADLIKMAMVAIDNDFRHENIAARCILQIHDELVFELSEAELDLATQIVTRDMEYAIELAVPLKVNTGHGRTWMEIH